VVRADWQPFVSSHRSVAKGFSMIRGSFNDQLEPWIELAIQDQHGERLTVQALLDTGFNGFLMLPTSWLLDMGLELADGSETVSDLFTAIVLWDGQWIAIDVEAADTDPLVGMALLAGHDLQMRVIPQGEVAINAIPSDA